MNTIKFLLVFLLFLSCSNRGNELRIQENVKSNDKVIEMENFEAFWSEFARSLKSNDTLNLINLSLPVIDVGTIDATDRSFSFKGKEIAQVILFEYQNGGYYDYEKDKDVSNIEMMDLPLIELLDYKKDSDEQRINNFVFEKSKSGWKLTGIYTKIDTYFKSFPGK